MKIDILTIFPELFEECFSSGMPRLAIERGLLNVDAHDLRAWTKNKHKQVDDEPYGGGPGMVMKPEPLVDGISDILGHSPTLMSKGERSILLTPQGKRLDQKVVEDLSLSKRILLVCGRYEGMDERVRSYVTDEISIGDYVISGGEMAAMVIVDAVTRLIEGVLGEKDSLIDESFINDRLEYPQYTRPPVFNGDYVPQVLLSGNHQDIDEWRKNQAKARTKSRRPDLIKPD